MKCTLTSTDRQDVYENVSAIMLPAVSGETQILPGHAESFFQLGIGSILLQRRDSEVPIAINAGFCHVLEDEVIIII